MVEAGEDAIVIIEPGIPAELLRRPITDDPELQKSIGERTNTIVE
ncbi:hypothetical protein [Methanolobus halotolerans]|nr:hypothetical protein [Methanolobus halotolerans]